MLDVPKALRATKKSERQLGADVLALWKRLDHADRKQFPQPEAIGVKLGLLRRGETKWWTNQPGALEALAQILGCRPNEIIPPDHSAPGAVPITAFTDLAPILPGQDACQLRDDGSWVGTWADSLLHHESRAWLIAPPGSGKSLALQVLLQRHGSRVQTVRCRRLVEVVPRSKRPSPLIAEVSEVDPATDEAALKALSKVEANVCVLAAFSHRVVRDSGRRGWREHRWAPNADWRPRLVKWANARALKPEDLDVEEVMHFLEGIDPHQHLFGTPGDVLAVAARAYRAGLPKGPRALHELARESLGRLFSSNDSSWARSFGLSAVEALVDARLASTDLSAEPLALDVWAKLFPANLAHAPSPNLPAKSKSRHPAEQLPSIQAVRTLADFEVLRTSEDGRFDFAPWVRAAIERETVGTQLRGSDLSWALWGVEPMRRAVVDDALDAASPAALLRVVRHALSADSSDLGTVAAIEALFSALARKLAREWTPSPQMVTDLQELGLRQLQLVGQLPEGHAFPRSAPLTRQPREHGDGAVAQWIGEAWTYSNAVPRPKGGADSGWIFPGWSRSLRMADAPEMLPLADEDPRLLRASRTVVRACIDSALPERVPRCLLPWVIIDGPSRGWTVTKAAQKGLFHTAGVARLLGQLLLLEPTEVRALGARTVWSAALVEGGGDPFSALVHLEQASIDLHRVVLELLPADAFETAFRAKHPITGDEGRLLGGLPPRLVRPALVALVEQMEGGLRPTDDIDQVLEALSEDDLDLLLRFGAHGFDQGYAAARRVWSLSAGSALDQARFAMEAGAPTAQVWFETAPVEQLPALLAALEGVKSAVPLWSADWLAGALPRAGHAAPAVFALLRRFGRTR